MVIPWSLLHSYPADTLNEGQFLGVSWYVSPAVRSVSAPSPVNATWR